jgi:ATP-dependent exoDNAse (exonuclease V) alpha subunit
MRFSRQRPRPRNVGGGPQAREPEAPVALYMLQVKVVSRWAGGGGSIVAGAAYRAGERLVEHDRARSAVASAAHLAGVRLEEGRAGVAHDFRGKAVEHAEVMLPAGAPAWMADRERLWNAVEAAEKRCDARLGRELVVALPRELGDAENLELVRTFVAGSLTGRGMVADFAIHAPTASDGLRQPHAHILANTRAIDPASPTGFGAKVRRWDKRELVTSLRQEWAEHCNRALELAQVRERVDHRSLAAQLAEALEQGDFDRAAALDRLPGIHLGPAAHAMEREGIATDKGDELRAIREENRQRAELYVAVREIAEDVPDASERFLELRQETGDPLAAFETWGGWARERLERVAELARDVVEFGAAAIERTADLARSAVETIGDWFSQLSRADDTRLREAREELRERELRHEEREIAEIVQRLDAREQEREQAREADLEQTRQRSHGLELGG